MHFFVPQNLITKNEIFIKRFIEVEKETLNFLYAKQILITLFFMCLK